MRTWRRTALLLAALAGGPRTAAAHDQPYSFLDVHLERGMLAGTVMAHVVDLAHAAGIAVPESLLSPGFVRAHEEALREALAARMTIEAEGAPVHPSLGAATIVADRKRLSFSWQAPLSFPAGRVTVRGPLFPEDPAHESYVNLYDGATLRVQQVLDRERHEAALETGRRPGLWPVVLTFLAQGIHHIAIGPDHILFIVGLVLAGGGARRLLKIATAFTLAHSITLALATLRVANPPARIIEPLIALSIVWVGLENLRRMRAGSSGPPRRDLRVPIAFGFGLVHGFGFAGVLREFGLPAGALAASLVSFNLGVEVAQAAIVLTLTPALAVLGRRAPQAAAPLLRVGSLAVLGAGGVWLVQRVVG